MKTLITPGEVSSLAFSQADGISGADINEASIASAERKFIRPALGELYDELLAGGHAQLADLYIKAPLALYVKWLLLPSLALRVGPMGVARHTTDNLTPAGARDISLARRRVKADARALMQVAVEHIAANPGLYPSFSPQVGLKPDMGIVL